MNLFFNIILNKSTLTIIAAIIITVNSYAETLPFKHLLNEDGLQNNNIHCILQDQYGFLWFGTENGLHRYDGIEFTLYEHNPNNINTISGNVVFRIIEDHNKNLWFSTNNGFDFFDRKTNSFIHIPLIIKLNGRNERMYKFYSPSSMVTDNNNIYVSTGELGVYVFNPDSLFLELPDWLNNNINPIEGVVTSMNQHNKDQLWLGTQFNGIYTINLSDNTFIHYKNNDTSGSISSDVIYSILTDSKGRLWIGTGNGLNLFNGENGSFSIVIPKKSIASKTSTEKIYTISSQPNGNVWFGTDGNGIYVLDNNNQFSHYQKEFIDPNSLYSNYIRSIYHDIQGNLWVGTREGGINYVLNNNAVIFNNIEEKTPLNPGLGYRSVTTIHPTYNSHKIWVGTDGGGIDLIDPLNMQVTPFIDKNTKSVLAIYEDENHLWYGGYMEGLNLYNKQNKTFKRFMKNESDNKSLAHNDVRFIMRDSNSKVWIATNGGGLQLFDEKTHQFKHFQKNNEQHNSIISNYCTYIYEDRHQNLWIGTYDGFSIMNQSRNSFENYFSEGGNNSLSGDWIYAFCEDSKGRMWIGTNFGLNLFDRNTGTFTVYSKLNGLPGNEIMGIVEDANYNLWISTNNGICMFEPESKKFTLFDYSDGLTSNQFNHGSYLVNNNNIFFGGNRGLSFFNPNDIKINTSKPPVYITDIESTGKHYFYNIHHETKSDFSYPKLTLNNNESSSIYIHFTALNYINSKKNNYRYMLEGFDRDWVDLGNLRYVNYTNLSPGIYTFKVIASNNNNIWNEAGASIQLEIEPPFYLSKWALIFYLLLFFFIVMLVYRYLFIRLKYKRDLELESIKREKTEELARMKSDFFVNISHELSTPITLILVPLQRMFDMNKFDQSLIKTALTNSHRLLRLVNELLNFQKIEDDKSTMLYSKNDINLFVAEIVENFKEVFDDKKINLNYESTISNSRLFFDTEKMEKIIYNLISNAYKYTKSGGKVEVLLNNLITNNQNNIEIIVKDNGIGIAPNDIDRLFEKYYRVINFDKSKTSLSESTGYGIGLYMTKRLIELHKGEVYVESQLGEGTTFKVFIPQIEESEIPDNQISKSIKESNFKKMTEASDVLSLNDEHSIDEIDDEVNTKRKNPLLLIIEDNKELMNVLHAQLEEHFKIIEAFDGLSGLKMANRHLPDLIITDVMMPGIDGMEVCERIKNDIYTSHIPVIILTALNTNEYKLKGFSTKADDYITKPFNPQILETRIINLIESRKLLQKKFLRDISVKPSEITVTPADQTFVEKAIKSIENNIEEPQFSVTELAKCMNMSNPSLNRKIKAITSQTPNIFIRTIRLKRAAQLLKTGNYSVTEVVYMVGLNDIKYFRQCFQKQFGMNPLDFINQHEDEGIIDEI